MTHRGKVLNTSAIVLDIAGDAARTVGATSTVADWLRQGRGKQVPRSLLAKLADIDHARGQLD